MDNCNLARRSIKHDKSNDIAIYSEMLRDNRCKDKTIQFELNEAIRNEQIEVFLQPKFDMKTFKIIGAEALSRWRNPDGTYRSPVTFIPQLERLGHVVQLDFYIYEQVLKLMRKWKDDGIKLIPISINFSRIHNNYINFVDRVLNLANQYGIDKSLIEIEITESAFANSDSVLLNNIHRLRRLGFKIDIDDFGIGESSLSTLLDVPVDIIKLDKKFIDDLQLSENKQRFVKQLCLLIQTSNKNIIFEGVELQNQADFLCDCGFYMAQGWLFDKAISVTDFEKKYIY
jgi:EAL domain-containing protein (putative c-di-GMP-specific phosphodiesterase class I)